MQLSKEQSNVFKDLVALSNAVNGDIREPAGGVNGAVTPLS